MVDTTVVKDIKKALKRKFASRSNISRIFSQWSREGTVITPEDVFTGLNKIGIMATYEDALCLVSSAEKHQG